MDNTEGKKKRKSLTLNKKSLSIHVIKDKSELSLDIVKVRYFILNFPSQKIVEKSVKCLLYTLSKIINIDSNL